MARVPLPPDVDPERAKPCIGAVPHDAHWWPPSAPRFWCAGADDQGPRLIRPPDAADDSPGSVIVGPDGRVPYIVIEIGTGMITHVAADGTRTRITRDRINAIRAAWRTLESAVRPFLRNVDHTGGGA